MNGKQTCYCRTTVKLNPAKCENCVRPKVKFVLLQCSNILHLTFVIITDDCLILVDMRWNKQYLEMLANKCNFEDKERYVEFLEALNAVANRCVMSAGLRRVQPDRLSDEGVE